MTATNHGLVGALIGATLPLPVAIPLAFVSHFVMDAIPHFAANQTKQGKSNLYKLVMAVDSVVGGSLTVLMIINHRWDMLLCAWLAYLPDIPIVYHYFRTGSTDGNHHWPFKKRLFTLPHNEYEWGIYVELAIFALLVPLFVSQLS